MNMTSASIGTLVRITLLALALVASALGTASAFAQAASVQESVPEAVPESANKPDDTLYQELGGTAGFTALVDEFFDRLQADKRTNPFFRDVEQKKFRSRLVEQFCDLTGGPCHYSGKDMRKAHAGLDITRTDFNAVVEVLQDSLNARAVPFAVQNRLLAKLAPMHRDIVNVH